MDLKMEGSYIFTVVFTGLVVVFLGLIILIVCVKIMEQIFKLIDKAKASPKAPAPEKQPEAAKISAPAASAPEIEDGISDEIVAVIAAAVASMSGGYALKSVKKSRSSRRTAWGAQGVSESTRIF